MLAFRWSEREQKRPTRTSLHTDPVLPPGVDTVLSVLRSSAVVLDEADAVVKASSAAYALGLVRGGRLAVEPMLQMARDTRRDGEIRQVELDLPRRGTGRGDALAVSARVAPLGSRLVLLLVEDLTEARRIEAVRRDFVANVSHELKTPVGALSLLSEAVMDASRRPGGGRALRRPYADRGHPPDQPRAGAHRPLPGPERRPARGRRAGPRRRTGRRGHRPLPAPGRHQADHHGRRRHRRPARLGQPRPAGRRPRQPRRERRQLQPGPHPRGHSRPPGDRARRGPHRGRRHRPGHRHLREGQGARLRALLPRRPRSLPCHRRYGPGPRDRQARGRLARRGGHGVELRGTGLHVHPAAAGGGGCPRPRAPNTPTWTISTTRPAKAPPSHPRTNRFPPRRSFRDPSARRRGRGVLHRRPVLHAPQRGLRGRHRDHRAPTDSTSSSATAPTSSCST